MNQTKEEVTYLQREEDEIDHLIESLPKVTLRSSEFQMIEYQGFFYYNEVDIPTLKTAIIFQKHFIARDTDIFIISPAKTGTAWLKSLLFSTINRANYPAIDQIPLLTDHHIQQLVYSLDFLPPTTSTFTHFLNDLPSPRLLNTAVPYASLPESLITSGCQILYLCRSPYDTLMAFYYFFLDYAKKTKGEDFVPPSLEDCYQDFSEGKFLPGPFFEHVRQFWEASKERPDKVLFLQYEDLKIELIVQLKRLAEFIGMPFTPKEESEGVIQQIIDLCSMEDKKALEVRDWIKEEQFTPDMAERMTNLMVDKIGPGELFSKLLP